MSSLKKLVSLINRANKKRGYKQITFTTGRIKRMRSRRGSRYVRLDKRIGKRAYSFNSDFCSNFTRWNRH